MAGLNYLRSILSAKEPGGEVRDFAQELLHPLWDVKAIADHP